MFRVLSEDEVKADNLRKSFLYGSTYTIDNLTALLMDSNKGEFGMYEATARVKAHAIISWLKTITGCLGIVILSPDRKDHGWIDARDENKDVHIRLN